MPIGADPQFAEKVQIWNGLGGTLKVSIFAPGPLVTDPVFEPDRWRRRLSSVSLVIADLSYERPSSYYEVGFVNALAIPIALIARTGTILHQLPNTALLTYYDDLDDYQQLGQELLRSNFASAEAAALPAAAAP